MRKGAYERRLLLSAPFDPGAGELHRLDFYVGRKLLLGAEQEAPGHERIVAEGVDEHFVARGIARENVFERIRANAHAVDCNEHVVGRNADPLAGLALVHGLDDKASVSEAPWR